MALADMRRKSEMLAHTLTTPGLTGEMYAAIARRAEALEAEAHRTHIENLARMGKVLIGARREFGDAIADAMAKDPAALARVF